MPIFSARSQFASIMSASSLSKVDQLFASVARSGEHYDPLGPSEEEVAVMLDSSDSSSTDSEPIQPSTLDGVVGQLACAVDELMARQRKMEQDNATTSLQLTQLISALTAKHVQVGTGGVGHTH